MITLNEREKILLQILAGLIAVLGVYFLIISPIVEYRARAENESQGSKEKLQKLSRIYAEYNEVKQQKSQYERMLRQSKAVTTLIEEYAAKTGILENKVYTRDRPGSRQDNYKKMSTDVKFEGVSIVPILEFIYHMENSGKLISVNYIRINQALKGRDTYDVTIKFDSIEQD